MGSNNHANDISSPSPSRMAEFLAYIKSARSFKGDLSAITAPTFILSPVSLVEFPSFWCEDSTLFVAPTKHSDRALRTVAVLKWYLSTLRAQWVKRKKKPLNPILGELFLGHWEDEENGRTEVVVEQVSHHPPISAYRIRNEKHGITMEGYYWQKTVFKRGPCIDRIGHVMLHLDAYDEDYLLTLPTMHLEGLIPPPPYPELVGESFIIGSNGMRVDIDYSGRGWLRGKKNSFHAKVYEEGNPSSSAYTVEGQWSSGAFTICDPSRKPLEVFDTTQMEDLTSAAVKPLEQQDSLESRRVWQHVSGAIEKGNFGTAGREKSKLEEEQRALRKQEKIDGSLWPTRYFQQGEWVEAEKLLAQAGFDIRKEDTKGIWRWSSKAQ